jgi:hypothetical protein
MDTSNNIDLHKDNIRRGFISSFKDKHGNEIKEGDIIKEVIYQNKEKYHYEERFNMMGNENVVKVIDDTIKVTGWCLRLIKWSKDCLIAERIQDSGTVSTTAFDYLNDAFISKNNPKDIEIISSIYE